MVNEEKAADSLWRGHSDIRTLFIVMGYPMKCSFHPNTGIRSNVANTLFLLPARMRSKGLSDHVWCVLLCVWTKEIFERPFPWSKVSWCRRPVRREGYRGVHMHSPFNLMIFITYVCLRPMCVYSMACLVVDWVSSHLLDQLLLRSPSLAKGLLRGRW